ncbi:hypothetical protein ABGB07_22985 [Micromonosporaceae bacterium B7E4]
MNALPRPAVPGETREWLLHTRDRDVPAVLDALADDDAWADARVRTTTA